MIKNPSEKTRKKAHDVLNGIEQIARNEMLIQGEYVTEEVVNEELAKKGAICGGRAACLIGSAYVSAGYGYIDEYDYFRLPGIGDTADLDEERKAFLRHRPGLRLAIEALDKCAVRRMGESQLNWYNQSEAYFEQYLDGYSQVEIRRKVISLCKSAHRVVDQA